MSSRLLEQRATRPNLRTSTNQVAVSGYSHQKPRQLPPSLFYYDEITDIIGEGTFGKCVKAYMQGTCVCLKQLKQTGTLGKMSLMHEASILANLSHSAVCFLHGIQSEAEPFYLVMNLYSCNGFSLTVHDLLHHSSKDAAKTEYLVSLQSILTTALWCFFMTRIAEALQYIHSRKILHRDLKPNNVVVFQKGPSFDVVLIDFGKSISSGSAVKYKLSENEKKQYRELHKHIAPDVIDGIYAPSCSSDIYSYGWICKNILHYSSSKFDKCITKMVSNCLKYHSTERLSAAEVIHTMTTI